MLEGYSPLTQSCLGTFFTWGVTSLGAALVFVFQKGERKVLDGSLGFAAGVMTAASFWSLLAPAIEMAEQSGNYGAKGEFAFIPVAAGFFLGALFVYGADVLLPHLGMHTNPMCVLDVPDSQNYIHHEEEVFTSTGIDVEKVETNVKRRKRSFSNMKPEDIYAEMPSIQQEEDNDSAEKRKFWNRILLMLVAITVHNIPEGLAVGVGFGAVGKSETATFENARNLALGIGIQNFPEGLAVSLPLRGAGMSPGKAFWYGQLSGMVEPIAGILGCVMVTLAEPILPYALAFAAGAMIFVVFDDIIPEAQSCGNQGLASWSAIGGFIVMMCLDVGLG